MFNKFKEVLKDQRKKSIIQLTLYFIFFAFVFIILSSGNNSKHVETIHEVVNDSVSSYEYTYRIINGENIKEVVGKLKDLEQVFTYNMLDYYKNDSGIFLIGDTDLTQPQNLDFDIDGYSYNNMESLIKQCEFIEKTTYKDGTEKTTYDINVDKYFDILGEENNCDILDCSLINVKIILETGNYINSINIDLTNYYNYNYIVEIFYSNINNIKQIKTNTL